MLYFILKVAMIIFITFETIVQMLVRYNKLMIIYYNVKKQEVCKMHFIKRKSLST